MNIKEGWRTTEFWTSIITALLGLGVVFGFITTEETGKMREGLDQLVGGVMTVVPIVAYSWSRGRAKSNIDLSSILELVKQLKEQQNKDN